ncbi:MAG TPA: hypothetical protein VGW78_03035 [Candidatus Babeliales bacterium]|nr:hypothetical protein [Candidatus Babeliales bacterium]
MNNYFSICMLLSVPLNGMYHNVRESFKRTVLMRYALGGTLNVDELRKQEYDNDHITYAVMEAVRLDDKQGLQDILPSVEYYKKHLTYFGFPNDIIKQELIALNKANDEKRKSWILEAKQNESIYGLIKLTKLR